MPSSKELKNNFLKNIIKSIFDSFGYQIKRKNNFMDKHSEFIVEAKEDELEMLKLFEKICLASKTNLWSINQSLKYLKNKNVSGDIVECGIYNGYTLAFIKKILIKNNFNKTLWGYDTFEEGFNKETISKKDRFNIKKKSFDVINDETVYYSLDQVISNINQYTSYDEKNFRLIKGNIIETLDIEENIPNNISFLRMDTDLYETTKKQLEILYPRLSPGGVLHIDDYGWMGGVKDAVDEYFKNEKVWLHRVDMTCRYMIK